MVIRKILTSRWFVPAFALAQTLRHIGILVFGYWMAARSDPTFDTWEYVRRDLARPFWEPYGFCGAWTHYDAAHSAILGLDFPVYVIATTLHSVVTAQQSCVDALMIPRGHVMTAALSIPLWTLAGLGVRRLAQKSWRRPVRSTPLRTLLYLPLSVWALGSLFLFLGATASIASNPGLSLRLLGQGFWLVWAGLLCAERLRVWPFDKLRETYEPHRT